jgi:hypothetical protein
MDEELARLHAAYRQAWDDWVAVMHDERARRPLWNAVNEAADAIWLAEVERGMHRLA